MVGFLGILCYNMGMRLKKILLGVLVSCLILLGPAEAQAAKLSDKQLYLHSLYSVFFYDGDGGCGSGTGAGNYNYAGASVFSEAELTAIEANRSVYEAAGAEYGVPWQVLAVLHSMETSLRRYNPANGQGVYQLYSYTGGGTNENRFEPASEITEAEFLRQTRLVAEMVAGMGENLDEETGVARVFFRYNGTSARYVERALNMGYTQAEAEAGAGSPYVYNRYDVAQLGVKVADKPSDIVKFIKE